MVNNHVDIAEAYVDAFFNTISLRSQFERAGSGRGEDSDLKKAHVLALLRQHGLDQMTIDMTAIEVSLPALTRLEALILQHEIRREDITREVERRRGAREAMRRKSSTATASLCHPTAKSGRLSVGSRAAQSSRRRTAKSRRSAVTV